MSPKLSPAPLLDLPYLLAAGLQTKTAEPTWFHHISVQADRRHRIAKKRPGASARALIQINLLSGQFMIGMTNSAPSLM
ncbi:hypothetical protein, partial [Mesorhizobium sp. M7A.T.Ca.TU.009.02.1.1]|uniref:hypothetical protein n=1 Tax=Mesorhizobium sp. M7A.T.Ca.TU.009.02.1.1 TaxID=2496791 RepID=UPI0019D2D02E